MLWKLDSQLNLEDILPIPQKPPGRHFSTSYHILGNTETTSYDVKYAQMTYGDLYRQKVVNQIQQESRRCESILAKERKKVSTLHNLTRPFNNALDDGESLPSPPRYDLSELRHHQRRCAALLFGARKRVSHEIPRTVQWEPKRRESYYLMSERIYNDRLMLLLRNKEESEAKSESPICFDFLDNEGDTDDLRDFQKFIQKTSKDISGMRFNQQYGDYNYRFDHESQLQLQGGNLGTIIDEESSREKLSSNQGLTNERVAFSDDVESELRCNGGRSRNGSGDQTSSKESQNMTGEENEDWNYKTDQSVEKSNINSPKRKKKTFKNNLSEDGHTDEETWEETNLSDNQIDDLSDSLRDSAVNSNGVHDSLHNNRQCRHLPKSKSQKYYETLPKLLKTSEMLVKLTKSTQVETQELKEKFSDHLCMQRHQMAYKRALSLARCRSLPSSYPLLGGKTTTPFTFSYFDGPRNSAVEVKEKDNVKKTIRKNDPIDGRKAIFGEVDMNNFYKEKDELIYYVKPSDLNAIVGSVTTGREDDPSSVATSKSSKKPVNSITTDTETKVS